MSREASMREHLMVALEPIRLDIINDSEKHAGHRSSPGTGESHFTVVVVAPRFKGLSRVDRHRLVNDALAPDLKAGVHALSIKAYAPDEAIG